MRWGCDGASGPGSHQRLSVVAAELSSICSSSSVVVTFLLVTIVTGNIVTNATKEVTCQI